MEDKGDAKFYQALYAKAHVFSPLLYICMNAVNAMSLLWSSSEAPFLSLNKSHES